MCGAADCERCRGPIDRDAEAKRQEIERFFERSHMTVEQMMALDIDAHWPLMGADFTKAMIGDRADFRVSIEHVNRLRDAYLSAHEMCRVHCLDALIHPDDL